jgi:hypothetical protein
MTWRSEHETRCDAIRSELVPKVRYLDLSVLALKPDPENPIPKELSAAHRRADKRIRAELGTALELVELGDVATLGYLEKRTAVLKRLGEMINALYKKLAYVRAIKSMAPPSLPAPMPPLLNPAKHGRLSGSRAALVVRFNCEAARAELRLDVKSGPRGVCCLNYLDS